MEDVNGSEEEFLSVTSAVSRCVAGIISHVRVAVETARKMLAAREREPCGLVESHLC